MPNHVSGNEAKSNQKRNRISRRGATLTWCACTAVAGLNIARIANATDISWVGTPGVPLDFATGSNWGGGAVPGTGDNGLIDNGGIATVATGFTRTVTDLRLGTLPAGSGTYTQTGGTINATGNMGVGVDATGAGSLNISGGVLNVGSAFVGVLGIGEVGTGTANISGGIINTVNMIVGRIPGGSGTVVQTGGSVNVLQNLVMFERAPDFVVGAAPPDFWTMSAGSITVGNEMYIGAHGPSTFNLSGTGSISVVGTIHIGASGGFSDPPAGVGSLNMSSGLISVTGANAHFVVADHGDGTFNFSGGTLTTKFYNIGQNFEPGFSTRGVVNHTGGSATAEYAWVIGEASRSDNLYDLSGGSVNVVGFDLLNPGDLNVAGSAGSKGTLIVRGTGVATIANSIHVGNASLTSGSISVSGNGSLSAGNDGSGNGQFIVGETGTGNFQISGGSVATDFLTLGQNVGGLGTGTQSAGSVTVRANMSIGEASVGANVYDITGGSLAADGIYVGSNGTGTLKVGGTAVVTATTFFESSTNGTGAVQVSGGSLTAPSFVNQGSYSQSGGTAGLGVVTGTGSMNVTGGIANTGGVTQNSLAISTTGRVNVAPNGTVAATSNVRTLNIAGGATPTGKLDLTNNALVVDYNAPEPSPIATIAAQITAGYAGGAWTGNGITSSSANSTQFGIGYAERASLSTVPAIFGTVDADAVLVRYTRYGDANLDGIVNANDFTRLASNFGLTGKGWFDGDFNYDNIVNANDFTRLASNFGLTATGANGEPTPQDWANLAAAVPEPASLSMLGVAALGIARRRRRNT